MSITTIGNFFASLPSKIESAAADFAEWSIDNSGITRIVSKEKLFSSESVENTLEKVKRVVANFVLSAVFAVPAAIGFTAQQIKSGAERAWTFVVGKLPVCSTEVEPKTPTPGAEGSEDRS